MKIDITLQLVSGYHSAPISSQDLVVTDEGRIAPKASGAKGSPLTPTYKEPKYIESLGEMHHFPVIRSLQVTKEFRKIWVNEIMKALNNRGLTLGNASTYAGLVVGAASGKPAQMNATFDQIIKAQNEPIALFGGGSFSLPSLVKFDDANVYHELLVAESLAVTPAHTDTSTTLNIEPYKLSFAVPITRQDPINDITNIEQMSNLSVIENHKEQIKIWQEGVSSSQNKRKANAEEKKSDLRNMVAFEAVIPGVTFTSTITLADQTGLAVKGAVLNALQSFIENGITIGGRISRGYGKMSVQASVDGALFEIDNFMSELDAYSDWLDNVTPSDLADFYEA